MGAYKEIYTQITSNTSQIGQLLIDSAKEGDMDQIKQSLKDAITNSALALAFIAEMEN